jgi:hypothetical protein
VAAAALALVLVYGLCWAYFVTFRMTTVMSSSGLLPVQCQRVPAPGVSRFSVMLFPPAMTIDRWMRPAYWTWSHDVPPHPKTEPFDAKGSR